MNKLLFVTVLALGLYFCTQSEAAPLSEVKPVLDDIKLVEDNTDKLVEAVGKLVASDKKALSKDEIENLKVAGGKLVEKEQLLSDSFEKLSDFLGLPKPELPKDVPK